MHARTTQTEVRQKPRVKRGTTLVAGISGQDGSYLAEHLLALPTLWAASLVFVLLLILPGCGSGGSASSQDFSCPALSANVTWTSYGGFTFGQSGDDSTARKIVSDCGWHVFDGHNGGAGDTLEVASAEEGVVFAWAYNSFSAFRLVEGWTGATDRGARLGDSVTSFRTLYPEFTTVSDTLLTYSNGDILVEAHFDRTGALVELLVGNDFRN